MSVVLAAAARLQTLRFHSHGEWADVLRLEQAPVPSPRGGRTHTFGRASALDQTPIVCHQGSQFEELFAAFDAAGGIAQTEEVEQLLEEHGNGDRMKFSKALSKGEILSIAWSDIRWVPLFQLEPQDLSVRREVASVLGELYGIYDDWELGRWFTEPNGWLDARRPVDVIWLLPKRVAQAARADRFIATC